MLDKKGGWWYNYINERKYILTSKKCTTKNPSCSWGSSMLFN